MITKKGEKPIILKKRGSNNMFIMQHYEHLY